MYKYDNLYWLLRHTLHAREYNCLIQHNNKMITVSQAFTLIEKELKDLTSG